MNQSLQGALGPMELERVGDRSLTVPKSIKDWREIVTRAMGRSSLSQKAMASDLGITAQQLSAQLSGRNGEHLSFWRMVALPSSFWQELLPLIVEFHGLSLTDSPQQRNDAEIGRLVREAVVRSIQR